MYEFYSSGYPPHEIDNSVNPNEAAVQNFTYNITVSPDNERMLYWLKLFQFVSSIIPVSMVSVTELYFHWAYEHCREPS